MKSNFRFLVLWALIIGGIMVILTASPKLTPSSEEKTEKVDFSQFMKLVDEGRVEKVTIEGTSKIYGYYRSDVSESNAPSAVASVGAKDAKDAKDTNSEKADVKTPAKKGLKKFEATGKLDSDLYLSRLQAKGIIPNYKEEEKPGFLQTALISWLPILAILFIFFLFMRQLQSGSSKAMSFGQSRAKQFSENQSKVRFKDVAGCDEAKEELEEIVDFLKNPRKFTKLGGRIPKGVLLIGPPGTGKTLLAKAIAGEASVPFFSISGSDFVEMFVGVGASRVRSLFENAKRTAPCLIFIDEIDAVGRHRGAGLGGGHDEREQTLNQLLVEMDGFEGTEGVILIAATNRADVLDPALLRPGRFDRRVTVSKPDLNGRHAILKVHTKRTPLEEGIDLEIIARGTPGFAGADLENLVNEAALNAARNDRDRVTLDDFEHAKDKVSMGSARRSMIISEEEKQHTAYHEAGHALVGRCVPGNDPVHKVTIIPRGPALGVTMTLPVEDRFTMTRDRAEAMLAFLFGGRVAEELKFSHLTTGASNDIERATELARKMVTEWGMSEKLGPVNFGSKNENIFLGREMNQGSGHSEATGQVIDQEIRDILERAHATATKVVKENMDKLEAMSLALLDRETIELADIDAIMEGRTLPERKITDHDRKVAKDKKEASTKEKEEDKKAASVIDLSKSVKA